MQSEIGGLFYEMAIRDHIRIEVLMQKAAELQRVDAELGQVERLLEGGHTTAGGNCAALWRGVRPRRGVLRPMRATPSPRHDRAAARASGSVVLRSRSSPRFRGLATAVVIATALGRTSAQSAATEALQHPPVVVRVAATQSRARAGRRPRRRSKSAPLPVDTSADAGSGADSSAPPTS